LASVVDLVRKAVVTAQRGQRGHDTVLPKEWKAYKLGTETTDIFPVWVWSGSLCTTSHLADFIGRRKRWNAVRPSQCAEIGQDTLPPKKGMRVLVSRQARKTRDPAVITIAKSLAVTATQRA
jgi:hypothetical protein